MVINYIYAFISVIVVSLISLIGVFTSCNTEEPAVKKNWVFTVTSVTTMTPDDMGVGPQTVVTTVEQNGLTAAEADAVIVSMNSTATQTLGGYTMTVTVTVTKAEKK